MNKKRNFGFILIEVIIAFLIISISLGVLFQNLSTSISMIEKNKKKLINAFKLETIGIQYLFTNELNEDSISIKEWPFYLNDTQYKFEEIILEKEHHENLILFLKSND